MPNEIYTDLEGSSDRKSGDAFTDAWNHAHMTDGDPLAQYWDEEGRKRELAVELTIRHFKNKADVSQKLFQTHLELIYNFLTTGKL